MRVSAPSWASAPFVAHPSSGPTALPTDLEAVFRSLKSELGLRSIYHHKPIPADGHLFIYEALGIDSAPGGIRKTVV